MSAPRWLGPRRRLTAVGVVAVLALVAGALALIAHPPGSHERAREVESRRGLGCSDALVIGLDGEGERPALGHTFGPTVDRLVQRIVDRAANSHRSVTVERVALSTARPSVMLAPRHRPSDQVLPLVRKGGLRTWRAPVPDGVRRTNTLLANAQLACPTRPVLLVGYAQGASVVHAVLEHVARQSALGGLVGGILVSDPDRVSRTVARPVVGDPAAWGRHSGIFQHYFTPRPDVPAPAGSFGVWEVCTRGDLVCDPGRTTVANAFGQARGYRHDGGLLRQVAATAFRQFALWPVPDPRKQVLSGTVGDPMSLQLTLAPDAPSGAVWADPGGLPAGVTLSPSGLLSGTPKQSGTFDVTYLTSGTSPPTTGHLGRVVLRIDPASVSLSAGGQVTCLTRSDGTARCWGRNDFGQLGDGTTTTRDTPVPVLGSGWASISTSGSATCGVKQDGTLWCWGLDNFGQLGIGRGAPRDQPTQVGSGRHWTQVSTAWTHTCAIRDDGTLWCWGQNLRGQLGIGTVDRLHGTPQREVTGTTWASVTTAGWHSCAVTDGGAAWCWGHNAFGEVGDGTVVQRASPTRIGAGTTWLQLSTAWAQTCGLSRSGRLFCWGFNRQGQLGDGTTTNRAKPTPVSSNSTWTQVTTGDGSTCATDVAGQLYCWGDDRYGQLGSPATTNLTTTPTLVADMILPTQQTSAGWLHTCVIPVGGSFLCWGNDEAGQLGDGTQQTATSLKVRHQVDLHWSDVPSETFLNGASPAQVAKAGLTSRPAESRGRAAIRRTALAPATIVSMNVLGSQHTAPGGDSPEFAPGRLRAEWAATIYRLKNASLVGMQESQPDQIVAIDAATSHQYRIYPGNSLGYASAPQSLMWRRSEWQLLWKSSISIPFTSGWRPQPIVELQQRSTGAQVYWINVHFSARQANQDERDKSMKILLAAIAKLEPDGLPILLTGDFNEYRVAFCSIVGRTDLVASSGGSASSGSCSPPTPYAIDWIFGSHGSFTDPVRDRSAQVARTTDHPVMSALFGTG